MANTFETLGEVGHAIEGVKDQLALHVKVFVGAFGLSVIVAGFLYNQYSGINDKVSDLNASNARIETKLEAITASLDEIKGNTKQTRADAEEIKGLVRTASATPEKPADAQFPGWIGVEVASPEDAQAVVSKYKTPAWIFTRGSQ